MQFHSLGWDGVSGQADGLGNGVDSPSYMYTCFFWLTAKYYGGIVSVMRGV